MVLRENIFDRQRILSSILRSERFPNDIYPRLQLMIKDVNSLINHADFSFQRLDYIQDSALGLINIEQNEIVKIYSQKDVYILSAHVTNQMVTLTQGVKQGNIYKETIEDYITNNETSAELSIELKSYWTDLKQTQYRLEFSKKIKDLKAKTLKPKQVIKETVYEWKAKEKETEELFYVYGLGVLSGVFEEAGDAVEAAEKLSGVVVSERQNCVWEADNRVSWYRNFNINNFTFKHIRCINGFFKQFHCKTKSFQNEV